MKSLLFLRVNSTETMGIIASKIKSDYHLSVADAWIAALAKQRNAILVHKDPEFEQIESEIQVLKLPYKTKA
jgi:predicted nucleic acid-binding protein